MNLLETLRSKHEDIERFQQIIRQELEFQPKTWKDSAQQTHVVNAYLERITKTREEICKIYEDSDGTRKEEINNLQGSGSQVYSLFYDKVKDIRNYYRQFPNIKAERPEDRVNTEVDLPPFSAEEGFGKYLDLHELHQRYLNLKKAGRMDYYSFLDYFFKFDADSVKDENYKLYLTDLYAYLIDFVKRSLPLLVFEDSLVEFDQEFAQKWQSGEFKVPEEPGADPLYCKICDKKFAKDTVFQGHLKGKKHEKGAEKLDGLRKDCLHLEFKIYSLVTKYLLEQIENSKVHIEKKIARGQDDSEDEEEIEKKIKAEPEDEVEIITTKQNYPVGWDGKPIPYWLYKLHGLGIEYKCEICGNTSYWGRKAYEMHFQEWRHAHGMKCLGVPNLAVFRDITKINDALMLWEKLRRDGNNLKEWKPEVEEEFEDSEGNVFNKKIYNDLKRQGLL